MTTNLDRSGGLANSNLMPGSAAGSGGDGGDGGTDYILVPNSDGSYPAAMLRRLLLTNADLSIGHEQVHHATDPTGTFNEVTNGNFLGAFFSGGRPSAGANQGRRLWNKSVGSWQIGVTDTDGVFGFTAAGWANTSPPSYASPWRGAFGTEEVAINHIQAAGDHVIYDDRLYVMDSDFVAGTDRTVTLTWQPLSEAGGILDLETLRYWQNTTAQGLPPNNVDQILNNEVGDLVPVSFPMLAGNRYIHFGLLRPYFLDTIYIAGEDRFSAFTATTTATDRYYHSPQLSTNAPIDMLVRIREGAD